jgi:dihydroxyacetone kinase-like protein
VALVVKALALDSKGLRGLLLEVAAALTQHSEEIRELDATVGDGDLGITVELMAKALVEFADSSVETDIGRLLMQCGMAVNRANPSTFGTVVASGFMGGGKAVAGKTSVDLADWVAIGEAAIESIKSRGKASVGDKTLLDALVPAAEALKAERRADCDAGRSASLRGGDESHRGHGRQMWQGQGVPGEEHGRPGRRRDGHVLHVESSSGIHRYPVSI